MNLTNCIDCGAATFDAIEEGWCATCYDSRIDATPALWSPESGIVNSIDGKSFSSLEQYPCQIVRRIEVSDSFYPAVYQIIVDGIDISAYATELTIDIDYWCGLCGIKMDTPREACQECFPWPPRLVDMTNEPLDDFLSALGFTNPDPVDEPVVPIPFDLVEELVIDLMEMTTTGAIELGPKWKSAQRLVDFYEKVQRP